MRIANTSYLERGHSLTTTRRAPEFTPLDRTDPRYLISRWLQENRKRAERLVGDQFRTDWRRIHEENESLDEIWEAVQAYGQMLDELEAIDAEGGLVIDTQARIILDDIAQALEAGKADLANSFRRLLRNYYTRPELNRLVYA